MMAKKKKAKKPILRISTYLKFGFVITEQNIITALGVNTF